MTFKGCFENQIDDKVRMRFPAKMRECIGSDPVITIGTENTLRIMTAERANAMFDKLMNLDQNDDVAQNLYRTIASLSCTITEDSQGRFVLPLKLKEYAKINKNITFIGKADYIEMWATEEYNTFMSAQEALHKASINDALKSFRI